MYENLQAVMENINKKPNRKTTQNIMGWEVGWTVLVYI